MNLNSIKKTSLFYELLRKILCLSILPVKYLSEVNVSSYDDISFLQLLKKRRNELKKVNKIQVNACLLF